MVIEMNTVKLTNGFLLNFKLLKLLMNKSSFTHIEVSFKESITYFLGNLTKR
jgi:hypothetical protein